MRVVSRIRSVTPPSPFVTLFFSVLLARARAVFRSPHLQNLRARHHVMAVQYSLDIGSLLTNKLTFVRNQMLHTRYLEIISSCIDCNKEISYFINFHKVEETRAVRQGSFLRVPCGTCPAGKGITLEMDVGDLF
ncbi:uncharacterized protein LOC143180039 isoform X1 [Calliopsis andreniformis]|uniref:uncharacterized protein LOC143180039 isoform X1 n=1 Tax=Calliopsis andreniformis TaxID=337506 RepID=UPI003FCC8DEF